MRSRCLNCVDSVRRDLYGRFLLAFMRLLYIAVQVGWLNPVICAPVNVTHSLSLAPCSTLLRTSYHTWSLTLSARLHTARFTLQG